MCFQGGLSVATLAITKTSAPEPAVVGRDLTYRIEVTNLGPETALNVVVTDLLPATVTLVTARGCTVLGRLVTCVVGDLAAGATVAVIIQVLPTEPGTIINVANAQAANAPLVQAMRPSQVLAATTITINKTAGPNPAFVGGTLTFTIPVTNTGTAPAENVVLTDALPGNVTFVSSNVPCTLGPVNVLTCNLGTIGPGATATVTIQVTPTAPGTIFNRATAAGTNSNAATVLMSTRVILAADLAVTKTVAATGEVSVGLTYTVTVTNLGPSTATGVTLVDALPPGVRFISVTPSQGTCAVTGRPVTCLLGTLASGATATVRILLVPTAPGRITNTATVTANEFDPNPANNTATAAVVVSQCCSGTC